MPSIYDEMEEWCFELEVDDRLSDREADALLEKLEARYARFRQEVFAKWPVAKQAAFERRALLYSCLQARETIAHFNDEMAEVEEGVDVREIIRHFQIALKRTQSALARVRTWRASGHIPTVLQ